MTKEQFILEMERIAALDWSITTTAATQAMFCMRYIESLEAENAALTLLHTQATDEMLKMQNRVHKLEAEIAQLQADNRSLVEQMNVMAMKQNQEVIEWIYTLYNPDFSNAKVGESCFDVELEHCEISEVREYDDYTMLMVDDGKGNLNPHTIHKEGYTHNPLLFNSFAQFQAYWAEKALEMGGNHD